VAYDKAPPPWAAYGMVIRREYKFRVAEAAIQTSGMADFKFEVEKHNVLYLPHPRNFVVV